MKMAPRFTAMLFACMTPAYAQQISDTLMVAHFIDVGQASSVLLEFSCGAVMIDAGAQDSSDSQALVDYLTRFFDRRTDLNNTIATLFITHNHVDHTRALGDVADAFTITNIIEHGKRGTSASDPGDRPLTRLIAAQATNRVNFIDLDQADVAGGFSSSEVDPVSCSGTNPEITVLRADLDQNPGWSNEAYKNKNNHSLVIRLDFGDASFLFTGDLQEEGIAELLHDYDQTTQLDVDVLHVGHHGSHNATTWELVEAVDWPEIAVISMDACNRNVGQFNAYQFGHPRADIIDILRSTVTRRRSSPKTVRIAGGARQFHSFTMRKAIYATGWDGTVTVRATKGGLYRVNVENSSAPTRCG